MTGTAITFLIIAIVVVWGGLVLSILNLRRAHTGGDVLDDDETPAGSDRGGPPPRDL